MSTPSSKKTNSRRKQTTPQVPPNLSVKELDLVHASSFLHGVDDAGPRDTKVSVSWYAKSTESPAPLRPRSSSVRISRPHSGDPSPWVVLQRNGRASSVNFDSNHRCSGSGRSASRDEVPDAMSRTLRVALDGLYSQAPSSPPPRNNSRTTKFRPSHSRSSSDTADVHLIAGNQTQDPPLRRRTSEHKSSQSTLRQGTQDSSGRPQSHRRASNSASIHSTDTAQTDDFWAHPTTGSEPPTPFSSTTRITTEPFVALDKLPHTEFRQSKPLPNIPESPVTPPQGAPAEKTWAYPVPKDRAAPSAVTWLPPAPTTSLERRAVSNAQQHKTPARPPLLTREPKYTVDFSELTDALDAVHAALASEDRVRVLEETAAFARAVQQTKTRIQEKIPVKARGNADVSGALAALEMWDALLAGWRTQVEGIHDEDEMAGRLCVAREIVKGLLDGVGELASTCAAHLNTRRADATVPEEGEDKMEDREVREVQTALDHALQDARGNRRSGGQRFLVRLFQRVLPKTSRNAPPLEDRATARHSWLITDNTMKQDAPSDSLNSTNDDMLSRLDLELGSAKIVLDSVARNWLAQDGAASAPAVSTDDVRYSANGTMLAATAKAMIRHLTDTFDSQTSDAQVLTDMFFLFFRYFMRSTVLLDLLIARYHEQFPPTIHDPADQRAWTQRHTAVKLHIVRFLALWLGEHYITVLDDDILAPLRAFTHDVVARDADLPPRAAWLVAAHLCDCEGGRRAQRMPQYPLALERMLTRGECARPAYPDSGFAPAARILGTLDPGAADIRFFARAASGVEELARALTLVESETFHGTMPVELFWHNDTRRPSAMLAEAAKWAGALTLWAAKAVLEHREAKDRAEAYGAVAAVMERCLELRNYSSAHAIVMGLSCKAVTQHEHTMRLIANNHKQSFDKVYEYFYQSGSNYAAYRQDMANTIAPAVPLFFVIHGDLLKIESARKLWRKKHGIEMLRTKDGWMFLPALKNLRKLIRELEQCYVLYNVPVVDCVQAWIKAHVESLKDVDYEAYMQNLQSRTFDDEEAVFIPPVKARSSSRKRST